MKKLLLIPIILNILNAQNTSFIDSKPSEITKENISIIKKFDRLAYNLSEMNDFKINTQKIYHFILKNQLHKEDYNRLTIAIGGGLGRRTARTYGENSIGKDLLPSSFNFYKTELSFNYNIYDPKIVKDITNKEIEYKSKVLSMVQKYVLLKDENHRLELELELARLKQIRLKIMVKTGQKYLDDRIKVIESILSINTKLSKNHQDTIYMKLELINLVKIRAIEPLKELL